MRPEDFTRQIEQFRARKDALETELSDPGVYAVPARASMLARERQRLENIFAVYDKWTGALKSAEENRGLLAKDACDKAVQVAEDVGVFAETEEHGERGRAAERRKATEQAVRFARHETELDDGEATDGCKYEAGKAERTEACLHCERNEEVGNSACDC